MSAAKGVMWRPAFCFVFLLKFKNYEQIFNDIFQEMLIMGQRAS